MVKKSIMALFMLVVLAVKEGVFGCITCSIAQNDRSIAHCICDKNKFINYRKRILKKLLHNLQDVAHKE